MRYQHGCEMSQLPTNFNANIGAGESDSISSDGKYFRTDISVLSGKKSIRRSFLRRLTL